MTENDRKCPKMTEAKELFCMSLWGVKIFDESKLTKKDLKVLSDCNNVLILNNVDYNKLKDILPEEKHEF